MSWECLGVQFLFCLLCVAAMHLVQLVFFSRPVTGLLGGAADSLEVGCL